MPAIAVVGAQWGDEGKGKVVDLLAEKVNMVVRYSGGNNAGHTVMNSYGQFTLHLVPSGIFHPQVICVIGNGVVVDTKALLQELKDLQGHGVASDNLHISDRAHLIMPYHILLDTLEEKARGDSALGTTRRGVGPAYVDKVARRGIRSGDLLDKEIFRHRLSIALDYNNNLLTKIYNVSPLSLEDIFEEYYRYGEQLASHIEPTELIIHEALANGKVVLLEGAQGTLLDPDFGTYPYVTSSTPVAAGASVGCGISPSQLQGIIGVYKAYTTRVGEGPMPTELPDETGELIRERAWEYGATTGRPRRCGWFDAVLGRYSTQVNGFTSFALTRLDVLDTLPQIKICTSYGYNGVVLDYPPSTADALEKCEPIYEELTGWQSSIRDIRSFKDLPAEARFYVKRIEELVGCSVNLIAVGPRREESIQVLPFP